jgi:thiol-disulfide isomerase/thioredoxin
MFDERPNQGRELFSSPIDSPGTTTKRLVIGVVAAIVVASITIVALARYQREIAPSISRGLGLSSSLNSGDYVLDMLIAPDKASPAPAFAEGTWINSETLTVEKLSGHVVLVEFWTYGCYNCRNTLPHVRNWDAKYRDQGLTIVGVHTPETDSEYTVDNVRREVTSLSIKFPVVTDNDYKTWKAYGVEAWPTIFVLDKQGRIRWAHVGEGRYDATENVIKGLLAE